MGFNKWHIDVPPIAPSDNGVSLYNGVRVLLASGEQPAREAQ